MSIVKGSEHNKIDELWQRLRRLEDIEAVRQLHYEYCRKMENGFDAEALGALWIEDGVWDGGPFGRHVGRAAIVDFFRRHSRDIAFSGHYLANEEITVDGDAGVCRCTGLVPVTFISEHRTDNQWMFVTWNNSTVRHEGKWLFETLRATVNKTVSGWALDLTN